MSDLDGVTEIDELASERILAFAARGESVESFEVLGEMLATLHAPARASESAVGCPNGVPAVLAAHGGWSGRRGGASSRLARAMAASIVIALFGVVAAAATNGFRTSPLANDPPPGHTDRDNDAGDREIDFDDGERPEDEADGDGAYLGSQGGSSPQDLPTTSANAPADAPAESDGEPDGQGDSGDVGPESLVDPSEAPACDSASNHGEVVRWWAQYGGNDDGAVSEIAQSDCGSSGNADQGDQAPLSEETGDDDDEQEDRRRGRPSWAGGDDDDGDDDDDDDEGDD